MAWFCTTTVLMFVSGLIVKRMNTTTKLVSKNSSVLFVFFVTILFGATGVLKKYTKPTVALVLSMVSVVGCATAYAVSSGYTKTKERWKKLYTELQEERTREREEREKSDQEEGRGVQMAEAVFDSSKRGSSSSSIVEILANEAGEIAVPEVSMAAESSQTPLNLPGYLPPPALAHTNIVVPSEDENEGDGSDHGDGDAETGGAAGFSGEKAPLLPVVDKENTDLNGKPPGTSSNV